MFDSVGIASKDIDRSIIFYNILGLEFEKYGAGHYEATTKKGIRLMLDSHKLLKKLDQNWSSKDRNTTTLGFAKSKPIEVDNLFKVIVENGFIGTKDPWNAFWGQRYASVLDPDGNQIDIFAPLDLE